MKKLSKKNIFHMV